MSLESGPYVQIAGFFDYIIEDKSGSLSLIRMIDTIIHQERGSNPPDEMPQIVFSSKMVIALKSGKARGRNIVRIVPELPNGSTKDAIPVSVQFDGEEKGYNIILNITFPITLEGLYWFYVYLGEGTDTLLSKIPLRARYERVITSVQ